MKRVGPTKHLINFMWVIWDNEEDHLGIHRSLFTRLISRENNTLITMKRICLFLLVLFCLLILFCQDFLSSKVISHEGAEKKVRSIRTEYGYLLRKYRKIWIYTGKYRKIRTRKNSISGHFSRSVIIAITHATCSQTLAYFTDIYWTMLSPISCWWLDLNCLPFHLFDLRLRWTLF